MEIKICGKCKKGKPLTDFYKHNRDGYRSRCKVCHREDNVAYAQTGYYAEYHKRPDIRIKNAKYYRMYRQRPEVKERIKVYVEECKKHPEYKLKRFARNYLRYRVRQGGIIKEPCVMCGKEQVEGHHSDYNQPLLVIWLCSECHRELHNNP